MDGKELQIGNYIEAFGIKRIVAGIFGGQDFLMLDTYIPSFGYRESTLSFRCEYAHPIPMTPEILAKNGFKTLEFYSELVISDPNEHTQVQWDGSHLRCKKMGSGELELTCCKYVHQLQNALHICGINKDIIL